MNFDQTSADCHVFTYKEGLLSRVGHDLKLRCERFHGVLEPDRVEVTFDASAFSVVGALRDGRVDPGALSSKDERQIVDNIRKGVLHPDRFPKIRFTATALQHETRALNVQGTLELHGVSKPISARARQVDGRYLAEVEIYTPDFGIPPFSALLGTLKVKPKVKVRLSIPQPASAS